ncbi:FkbM family methyltransferase [Stella sp.]|uniref:FkbM family methyltransferase n=1 Tax=Stella sp. TaxID=2912054 RepID=UPI0035AEEF7C
MTRIGDGLRQARGILRSLAIYYRGRERRRAMDRLHARFVRPGDLVFDVGSHVGDRIASFRRLGCRVVAVEPQPPLAAVLRLLYGRDRQVAIEPVAVGAAAGRVTLRVNRANPTVSTASADFIRAAAGAAGWEGQNWDAAVEVPVTTLDALVARHGPPAFVKIDVEGFEAEALAGLSRPLPALSFEFTTIQRDVAFAALDRVAALGPYRYAAALGESQRLDAGGWRSRAAMAAWIADLPQRANSGDVYAALDPPPD